MNFPFSPVAATPFGEHLIIDGYRCDPNLLSDRELIFKAIVELPEQLGMQKLSAEEIHFSEHANPQGEPGITGFALVEGSHISVHAFPASGLLNVDVFTCRVDLDSKLIIDWFTELFGIKVVDVNLLRRGLKFPNLCKS